MAKWTDDELKALTLVKKPGQDGYHEWGQMTNYSKSYEAFEIKRRRVGLVVDTDEALAEAERIVTDDAVNGKARAAAVAAAMDSTSPLAHLGRILPPSDDPEDYSLKTAFFDIEATDLKGNFGRLLCVSVANAKGDVTTLRGDDPDLVGRRLRDDSKLAVAVRDYLEQFDVLVGWNSKGYDVPFLNTRLLLAGVRPLRSDLLHIDLMWKARKFSLQLHSSRLDAVAKTFRTGHQKTPLDPDIWVDAGLGEAYAMDYIVEHCEADVLVLRDIFRHLKPLVRTVHR